MRGGDLLQMGGATGMQGFYKISGGTLNALASAAALQLGYNGSGSTGKMTIASAGVVNTLTVKLGSTLVSTALGILNLQGGVLRVNSVYNNSAQAVHQFNFSGGTLSPYNANATIGSATAANNTTITLSGTDATISSSGTGGVGRVVNIYSKLTGSGSITFTGTGTNVLIASNSDFAGNMTLNGGTTIWSNKCMQATGDLIFTNTPKLILAFNETNTIRKLIVNGVIQNAAVYNSANLPAGVTIAGTGAVSTMEGPPATGIVLIIE
jgi:hypothetical protein